MRKVVYPTTTKEIKELVANVLDDWDYMFCNNSRDEVRLIFYDPRTESDRLEIALV